jgi:molybdopterin converting factor subunit 1
MSLRVLFFASLADIVGQRTVQLDSSLFADVGSIYASFERDYPHLEAYRDLVLFAVNSEFAHADAAVKDGDEIAFFPPVSGG